MGLYWLLPPLRKNIAKNRWMDDRDIVWEDPDGWLCDGKYYDDKEILELFQSEQYKQK